MRKTKRTGSRGNAQRIVPLLVGGLVGVSSAVILSGNPATAAAKTVTVSFTANGASPSSVTLNPGDTVVYKNDVNPNGGGLLSGVGGAIRNVSVEVTNAAKTSFELQQGESQPVTYSDPVTTTFTADYEAHLLLGLVPADAGEAQGTVEVRDPDGGQPPVVKPAPQQPAPQQPAPDQGQDAAAAPQQPAQGSGGDEDSDGDSDGAGGGDPDVNYTPPGDDPAGSVVPGQGDAAGTGQGAQPPAVDTPVDEVVPVPEGIEELPKVDENATTAELDEASSDGATSSLGLPAIMAVVLLSMVSAGLVRTLMVRHASIA